MSAFLRGALLGAGLVGAFFAGYVLRNPPSFRSESSPTLAKEVSNPPLARTSAGPSVANKPVPSATKTMELPVIIVPPIHLASNSKEQYTPKIDFEELTPPAPDAEADFTPNDVVLQGIKQKLGINTNVLGDPQPVPAVLAEARKNEVTPPAMSPIPKMGPTPRPELPPPPVKSRARKYFPGPITPLNDVEFQTVLVAGANWIVQPATFTGPLPRLYNST